MTDLEKEIKNYRILACASVRGEGGTHPRRCLWDICGKPMIQWALEPVIQCKYVDKVVVCTEDRRIRDVVEKLGVKVIDRPLFQARDFPRDYSSGLFRRFLPRSMTQQAPLVYTETSEYVLYWLEEQEKWTPDIYLNVVVNLPLGSVEILNKVIETFFKDKEATEVKTFHPIRHAAWMVNPTTGRLMPLFDLDVLNRQRYPKLYNVGPYHLIGHPQKASSQGRRTAAVFIKTEEGIVVHTEEDLLLARFYMQRRLDNEDKSYGKKEKQKKNRQKINGGEKK